MLSGAMLYLVLFIIFMSSLSCAMLFHFKAAPIAKKLLDPEQNSRLQPQERSELEGKLKIYRLLVKVFIVEAFLIPALLYSILGLVV